MIFARDKSQMCNNLLQFAHVYAWGREHGRKVMSMRFSYKYPYFKISHSDLVSFPLYVTAKVLAALRLLPTADYRHDECDKAALERKMLRHRHIVVSGWYVRYYDLFLKYRDEICDLFTIDAQYTEQVRQRMEKDGRGTVAAASSPVLRLGVHIRRGDYAVWNDGIYCYSDERYAEFISQFAALMADRQVEVYLSTNDGSVTLDGFRALVHSPNVRLHLLAGNAVEDLYMLSACDYIIGPPSTYSLVAAMYRDLPLCRMDQVVGKSLALTDFKSFDYWFCRIV